MTTCLVESLILIHCVCLCLSHAVTEMLVNVLNIHGEDEDDNKPLDPGGEGDREGQRESVGEDGSLCGS